MSLGGEMDDVETVPVFIPKSTYAILDQVMQNSTLTDFRLLGDEAVSLLIQAAGTIKDGGQIGSLEPLSMSFLPLDLRDLGQIVSEEETVGCLVDLLPDGAARSRIDEAIQIVGLADAAEFCLSSLCFLAWIAYIKKYESREPAAYFKKTRTVNILTLWDLKSFFRPN